MTIGPVAIVMIAHVVLTAFRFMIVLTVIPIIRNVIQLVSWCNMLFFWGLVFSDIKTSQTIGHQPLAFGSSLNSQAVRLTRKLGHPEFYEGWQRGRGGISADQGFLLAQAWRFKQFIDICIYMYICDIYCIWSFWDLIITTGVWGINQNKTMFICLHP